MIHFSEVCKFNRSPSHSITITDKQFTVNINIKFNFTGFTAKELCVTSSSSFFLPVCHFIFFIFLTCVSCVGTTGPPKGVMLSHDNVTWTSKVCGSLFGLGEVSSRCLYSSLYLLSEYSALSLFPVVLYSYVLM